MAVRSRLHQFWLVLRKNFVLQIRRPLTTVFEITLPVLSTLVLITLRFAVPAFHPSEQCFVTFDSDHLVIPYTGQYTMYYTPHNANTSAIAQLIQFHLPDGILKPATNESEIVDLIMNSTDDRKFGCFLNGAAVVFNNLNSSNLSYTIRLRHETPTRDPGKEKWYTHQRIPQVEPTGPRVYDNFYLNEGFLHLEHVVGQAIIQWLTGKPMNLPSVEMRQLPYPAFADDLFLGNIKFMLPFLLMAAFLVSAGFLTKELVLEKESAIRETMKMMGLGQWVLWTTWYIKQLLFLVLPAVLAGVLLCVGQIFPHSNAAAVVLFMLVFLISMVSFSFLVSVWFDNSRLGLLAGFIFWFLTYFPHLFLASFYDDIHYEVKLVSCLLSNTCMGLAVNVISDLELQGVGLQFDNFAKAISLDDQFSVGIVVAMLLLDSVLYMVIAWYVSEVWPGRYGIPRKFYFPFQMSYWTGVSSSTRRTCVVWPLATDSTHQLLDRSGDQTPVVMEDVDTCSSEAHEEVDLDAKAGIQIVNLTKRFQMKQYGVEGHLAVNRLNLKVVEGQITALLGHNGAGKSTTISMLTGLFPPTSGIIQVNGFDITTEIDQVRKDLGICPQHNVLFDRLTVEEHLKYFAKLKGIGDEDKMTKSVDEMIKKLSLQSHLKKQAKDLSGGYKRKLSVGIAVIGEPSVLVLDEPTSGMDPTGRDLTWNLLQEKKKSMTILISTHNLADAEKADRIAIMVEGRLKCSGRPSFLKERYGVGYNLRVEMADGSCTSKVRTAIGRFVRRYKEKSFQQSDVHFLLPNEQKHTFSKLFQYLEDHGPELGIDSFSLQENKMEDVFIRAGEGMEQTWVERVHSLADILSKGPLSRRPTLPVSESMTSEVLNTAFQPVDDRVMIQESSEPASSDGGEALTSFYVDSCSEEENLEDISHHSGYPVLDQSFEQQNYTTSRLGWARTSASSNGWACSQSNDNPRIEHHIHLQYREPGVGRRVSTRQQVPSQRQSSFSHPSHSLRPVSPSSQGVHGPCRPSILAPILDKNEEEENEDDLERIDLGAHDSHPIYPRKGSQELKPTWLQQLRAIFTKRYLNFWRFKTGWVWLLILPAVFVAVGLSLAATIITHHVNDRPREMSLPVSAPSSNITLFWGEFADDIGVPFSLRDLNSSLFGDPYLFNYTEAVLNIQNIPTITSVGDCCDYQYQLLDSFCVTRSEAELQQACSNSTIFGYQRCLNRCLSCCNARQYQLPSCSNPRYQQTSSIVPYPNASLFCPSPPKLSLVEYLDPGGPLTDTNVFISELLLQLADGSHHRTFFEQVLGGFTFSRKQPAYSVCGCEDATSEACAASLTTVSTLNSLTEDENCNGVPSIPVYCDDLAESLDSLLGFNVSQLVTMNADSSLGDLMPTGAFPEVGSGNSADCNAAALSANPTCVAGEPGQTAFCVDLSCNVSGTCDTSSQSPSAQYGAVPSLSENVTLTIWYNNQPYHISPSLLNVLHNLYLRSQPSFGNYSITVHNHPLPRHPSSTISNVETDVISFAVGVSCIFGFGFLLASFSLFVVQEKVSKAKHLQIVSGLRLSAYWFGNLSWDLLTALIPITVAFLIFVLFQFWVEPYSGTSLIAVLVLLCLLCWAGIPFVYFFSLFFGNIYTAYTGLFAGIFMSSLAFLAIIILVGIVGGLKSEADMLHYVFLLNPGYAFAVSLSDLYISHVTRDACMASEFAKAVCEQYDYTYASNPFQFPRPGVATEAVFLLCEGLLFFCLTLLADHWNMIKQCLRRLYIERCRSRVREESDGRVKSDANMLEMGRRAARRFSISNRFSLQAFRRGIQDSSVKDEKKLVQEVLSLPRPPADMTVVVGCLVKDYHDGVLGQLLLAWNLKRSEPVVRGISLIVRTGECFGLLGFNGAGKTTTFKMLTGDIKATDGIAVIAGFNLHTELRQMQQHIGYCPQFDALIDRLTGRELLTMFARLRGIPDKEIANAVEKKITALCLEEHADRQCWKYSGGNRRKLSTAIALIGNPQVIFLDEPTTGMDIKARKDFVDTLRKIVKEENKSVIVTSHSLNECESLCDRIGIMIKGKLRCLGTHTELTSNYGESGTQVHITVEKYVPVAEMPTVPVRQPVSNLQIPSILQPSADSLDNLLGLPSSAQLQAARPRSNVIRRLQSISRAGRRIIHPPLIGNGGDDDSEDMDEQVDLNHTISNQYLKNVCQRMREIFSDHHVKRIGCEEDAVTFQIEESATLSEVFRKMEQLTRDEFETLHICNYSVSQASLEQVFNYFAREQSQYSVSHDT